MTEKELNIPFDWVLWVGESKEDYLLNGDVTIPTLEDGDDIYFAYNQSKKNNWKSDCTLFAPMTAISALFNYKFTDEEIESIRSLAHTMGKVDNKWWYTQLWVKCICDRWNTNRASQYSAVTYWRTPIASDLFFEATKKKNLVVVSINGNGKLTIEQSTGVMSSTNLDGAKTYGHALSNTGTTYNWEEKIKGVDNYNKQKDYLPNPPQNEYVVLNEAAFKGSIYQASAYIIVREVEDLEERGRLEKMKAIVEKNIADNSSAWNDIEVMKVYTNDTAYNEQIVEYQSALHTFNNIQREKLKTIKAMLGE